MIKLKLIFFCKFQIGYLLQQNHRHQAEEHRCIQADWLPDGWLQNLQEFLNKFPSKDLVTMLAVPILEYSRRHRQLLQELVHHVWAQARTQTWTQTRTRTQEIIMTQIQETIMIYPWPQEVRKSVTFWMTYWKCRIHQIIEFPRFFLGTRSL